MITPEAMIRWIAGHGAGSTAVPIPGHPTALVMPDAVKINGVRASVSARWAQVIADALGASLPTAEIEDAIWEHAERRIPACLGDPVSTTDEEHSSRVDAALLAVAPAPPGGIVATVGKSWISHPSATAERACNYGWHDARAPHRAATAIGTRVWQPIATAHNLDHVDYSQTLRLWIPPAGRAPRRQPGVPVVPMAPAPSARIGVRAAWWTEALAALYPSPSRSRVTRWLAPCERDGRRLGLVAGNHCAAAACAAMAAALNPGEPAPHPYRAGAKELMRDAIVGGAWRPSADWAAGSWAPELGDLAIYDRSVEGRPETGWWGHVDRVVAVHPDPRIVETIGANEGPAGEWRRQELTAGAPRLLGFVEYPRGGAPATAPAELPADMGALLASLNRAIGEGLAEMREAGWWARHE